MAHIPEKVVIKEVNTQLLNVISLVETHVPDGPKKDKLLEDLKKIQADIAIWGT